MKLIVMKKIKLKSIILIIITLALISPMFNIMAETKTKKLVFGVHPYLHATTLVERFTPLTEYIEEQLGYKIHIRVATTYQDHIDAINQGYVDFAFMGPASYIKLTQDKNYSLLGRLSFSGKSTFRGVIFSRKDSPLTSIKQLHKHDFAFGDPNSTLSSRVPQRILADAGVRLKDLNNYSHLKNHHNVALAVLMGKYNAGAIKEEVYHEYESRGLKVLKWTPDIPSHPFVASSNMTTQQVKQLQKLLHNIHLQPNANRILQKVKKGTIAIIPAQNSEYAQLRKLLTLKETSQDK